MDSGPPNTPKRAILATYHTVTTPLRPNFKQIGAGAIASLHKKHNIVHRPDSGPENWGDNK